MIMKRIVLSIIALVAVVCAANAQTVKKYQEYTQFNNIEASHYFDIELVYGDVYSTTMVVDSLISDYALAYVKGNTLTLKVDEKSYAPEVKKALKGKNAVIPTLKVKITLPSINKITLSNTCVLYSNDENGSIKSDVLKINASNSTNIKSLTVDAKDVEINLENKAAGRFDIVSNSVTINADNSAGAIVALNCNNLVIGLANSTNVSMNGTFKSGSVKTKGSSTLTMTGEAAKLSVDGSNSSRIYADGLLLKDSDIVLTNSALCEINAKEHIKVDLTNSSHLVFNANPSVEVSRIVSSTMTRSSDTQYRKK